MDEKEKSPELLAQERGDGELTERQDKDKNNPVNSQIAPAEFSYFVGGIKNTQPRDNTMTVERLAKGIRTQFVKETAQIRQYLSMGDTAKADAIKQTLPYCTPAGTFTKRGNSGLIKYSGFLVLDIDDLDDVETAKQKILSQTDVDIILLFVSPSGKGLKVFVPATTEAEHLQVFRMYQRYFAEQLGLQVDESGKDLARACFLCHDDNVYVSEKYEFRRLDKYWDDPKPERSVSDLQRGGGAGAPNEADDVAKVYQIVAEIKSRGIDLAPEYDDYLKLGFALSTLGETGRQAFHDVCSQSPKYNRSDADEKFTECLKNGRGDITIATFFQTVKDAGIDITKINGRRRTRTNTQTTETLNDKIEGDNFLWYCFANGDEVGGAVISSPARIAKFFEKEGFTRISEQGDDRIIIVKSNIKTLKPFNHEADTISYLCSSIKHPARELDIKNWLSKNLANTNKVWKLLDGTPYNLQKDSKDAVYLYFANGVAKVTKTGIKMVDYASPEIRFYPQVESMNHTFVNKLQTPQSFKNRPVGDFEAFLNYAILGTDKTQEEYSKADALNLRAFYSMIGYLLSNHKNMADTKAIVLTDAGADGETRRGGRGKSLIMTGLQQLRTALYRGGDNEIDLTYRHFFANLEKWHDLFLLDDLPPNFNFDALFTPITGNITAERKGRPAVTIPFTHTPKFCLSTNWLVRFERDAASVNRRFAEFKLSDFWNENRKPDLYFKRNFFSEWDSDQWQWFFEFMATCIFVFLNTGLETPTYTKVDDNYYAYFGNPVEEERFNVVFGKFYGRKEMTVTEFMNAYDFECGGHNRGKFGERNIRKAMEAFIAKRGLKWKYVKRERRMFVWVDDDNPDAIDEEVSTDELPF